MDYPSAIVLAHNNSCCTKTKFKTNRFNPNLRCDEALLLNPRSRYSVLRGWGGNNSSTSSLNGFIILHVIQVQRTPVDAWLLTLCDTGTAYPRRCITIKFIRLNQTSGLWIVVGNYILLDITRVNTIFTVRSVCWCLTLLGIADHVRLRTVFGVLENPRRDWLYLVQVVTDNRPKPIRQSTVQRSMVEERCLPVKHLLHNQFQQWIFVSNSVPNTSKCPYPCLKQSLWPSRIDISFLKV